MRGPSELLALLGEMYENTKPETAGRTNKVVGLTSFKQNQPAALPALNTENLDGDWYLPGSIPDGVEGIWRESQAFCFFKTVQRFKNITLLNYLGINVPGGHRRCDFDLGSPGSRRLQPQGATRFFLQSEGHWVIIFHNFSFSCLSLCSVLPKPKWSCWENGAKRFSFPSRIDANHLPLLLAYPKDGASTGYWQSHGLHSWDVENGAAWRKGNLRNKPRDSVQGGKTNRRIWLEQFNLRKNQGIWLEQLSLRKNRRIFWKLKLTSKDHVVS